MDDNMLPEIGDLVFSLVIGYIGALEFLYVVRHLYHYSCGHAASGGSSQSNLQQLQEDMRQKLSEAEAKEAAAGTNVMQDGVLYTKDGFRIDPAQAEIEDFKAKREQEERRKQMEAELAEQKKIEEATRRQLEEAERMLAEQRKAAERAEEEQRKLAAEKEAEESAQKLLAAERQREEEQRSREEEEEMTRKLIEAEKQREEQQRRHEMEEEQQKRETEERQRKEAETKQKLAEEERHRKEAEEFQQREIESIRQKEDGEEEVEAEQTDEYENEQTLKAAERQSQQEEEEEEEEAAEFAENERRLLAAEQQIVDNEAIAELTDQLINAEKARERKQRMIEENARKFLEAEQEMVDMLMSSKQMNTTAAAAGSTPQTPVIEEPCVKKHFHRTTENPDERLVTQTVKTQLRQGSSAHEPYSLTTKTLNFPGLSDEGSSIEPLSSQQSSFGTQASDEVTTSRDYSATHIRQEPDGEDTTAPDLQYTEDYLRSLDGIKQRPLQREEREGRRRAFKKRRSSASSTSSRESRVSREEEVRMFTSLEEEELHQPRKGNDYSPIKYSSEPMLKVRGHQKRHKRSPVKDAKTPDEEQTDPWGEIKPEHYRHTEFWQREKAMSIDEEEIELPGLSAVDVANQMHKTMSFEEASEVENEAVLNALRQQKPLPKEEVVDTEGEKAAASINIDTTKADTNLERSSASPRLRRSPRINTMDQYEEHWKDTNPDNTNETITQQTTPTISVQTAEDTGPWRDQYGLIMEGLSDFYDFSASVNPSRSRSTSRNPSPAKSGAAKSPEHVSFEQAKDVSITTAQVEVYDDTDNIGAGEFSAENINAFFDSLSQDYRNAITNSEPTSESHSPVVEPVIAAFVLKNVADDPSKHADDSTTLKVVPTVFIEPATAAEADEDNPTREEMNALVDTLRTQRRGSKSRSRSRSPLPTMENLQRSLETRRSKLIKHNDEIYDKLFDNNETEVKEEVLPTKKGQDMSVPQASARSRSRSPLPTMENVQRSLETRRNKLIKHNDEIYEKLFDSNSSTDNEMNDATELRESKEHNDTDDDEFSAQIMENLVQTLRLERARSHTRSHSRSPMPPMRNDKALENLASQRNQLLQQNAESFSRKQLKPLERAERHEMPTICIQDTEGEQIAAAEVIEYIEEQAAVILESLGVRSTKSRHSRTPEPEQMQFENIHELVSDTRDALIAKDQQRGRSRSRTSSCHSRSMSPKSHMAVKAMETQTQEEYLSEMSRHGARSRTPSRTNSRSLSAERILPAASSAEHENCSLESAENTSPVDEFYNRYSRSATPSRSRSRSMEVDASSNSPSGYAAYKSMDVDFEHRPSRSRSTSIDADEQDSENLYRNSKSRSISHSRSKSLDAVEEGTENVYISRTSSRSRSKSLDADYNELPTSLAEKLYRNSKSRSRSRSPIVYISAATSEPFVSESNVIIAGVRNSRSSSKSPIAYLTLESVEESMEEYMAIMEAMENAANGSSSGEVTLEQLSDFHMLLNLEASQNRTLSKQTEVAESILAEKQRQLDEEALETLKTANEEVEIRLMTPTKGSCTPNSPSKANTPVALDTPPTPDLNRSISEEWQDFQRIKNDMLTSGLKRSTYVGESMDLGSEYEPLRLQAAQFQRSKSPSPSVDGITYSAAEEQRRKQANILEQLVAASGEAGEMHVASTPSTADSENYERSLSTEVKDTERIKAAQLSSNFKRSTYVGESVDLSQHSVTDYDRSFSKELYDTERIKAAQLSSGLKRSTYVGESVDLSLKNVEVPLTELRREMAEFQRSLSKSRSPLAEDSELVTEIAEIELEAAKRELQDRALDDFDKTTKNFQEFSRNLNVDFFDNDRRASDSALIQKPEILIQLQDNDANMELEPEEYHHFRRFSLNQEQPVEEYPDDDDYILVSQIEVHTLTGTRTWTRADFLNQDFEKLKRELQDSIEEIDEDGVEKEVTIYVEEELKGERISGVVLEDEAGNEGCLDINDGKGNIKKDLHSDMNKDEGTQLAGTTNDEATVDEKHMSTEEVIVEQVDEKREEIWHEKEAQNVNFLGSEVVNEDLNEIAKGEEQELNETINAIVINADEAEMANDEQNGEFSDSDMLNEDETDNSEDERQTVVEVDDEIDTDITDFNDRGPTDESHHEQSECEEAEREVDHFANRDANDWLAVDHANEVAQFLDLGIEAAGAGAVADRHAEHKFDMQDGAIGGFELPDTPFDAVSSTIDEIYNDAIKNRKQSGILRDYDCILEEMQGNFQERMASKSATQDFVSKEDERYALWAKTRELERARGKQLRFETVDATKNMLEAERKEVERDIRYLGDANVSARQSTRLHVRYGYNPLLQGSASAEDVTEVDLNYKPRREYNWRKNFKLDEDEVDKGQQSKETGNGTDVGSTDLTEYGEESELLNVQAKFLDWRKYSLGGESITLFSRSPETVENMEEYDEKNDREEWNKMEMEKLNENELQENVEEFEKLVLQEEAADFNRNEAQMANVESAATKPKKTKRRGSLTNTADDTACPAGKTELKKTKRRESLNQLETIAEPQTAEPKKLKKSKKKIRKSSKASIESFNNDEDDSENQLYSRRSSSIQMETDSPKRRSRSRRSSKSSVTNDEVTSTLYSPRESLSNQQEAENNGELVNTESKLKKKVKKRKKETKELKIVEESSEPSAGFITTTISGLLTPATASALSRSLAELSPVGKSKCVTPASIEGEEEDINLSSTTAAGTGELNLSAAIATIFSSDTNAAIISSITTSVAASDNALVVSSATSLITSSATSLSNSSASSTATSPDTHSGTSLATSLTNSSTTSSTTSPSTSETVASTTSTNTPASNPYAISTFDILKDANLYPLF